jgi:hypothetical protein
VRANGTYLAAFLKMNMVVEFGRDFSAIWTCEISTPWAAVRLHDGKTLIADKHDRLVREVTRNARRSGNSRTPICRQASFFHNIQTADRLANRNTAIFSSKGGTKAEDRPNSIQDVELSPEKKVVWVLRDSKSLDPATTAKFQDEPGTPERRGFATLSRALNQRGTGFLFAERSERSERLGLGRPWAHPTV